MLGEILTTAPERPRGPRCALSSASCPASRRPRRSKICGRYLASVGDRREAFEDIYWSLINSTEFITRR